MGCPRLMKKGDSFIPDRGFRDVINLLVTKGFNVLNPALKAKRSQLTTIESKEQRFVTKIRWTVEAVYGMTKQKYRLLDENIDNKFLSKAGLYLRICRKIAGRYRAV